MLHDLETELERIEEQLFADISPRENIEALYPLKQKLMVFRHALGPFLESLGNVTGARVPALCSEMQEFFRDVSDHLQRLDQTIESVRDTISTAISMNLSMITLQESETIKRLAAYAALIAVPTRMATIDVYLFYRVREAKWL